MPGAERNKCGILRGLRAGQSGRGISAAETQLLKKAENAIEQEFSFALQVSPQEISRYLQAQLGQALGA